jgi:hypothetical protein
MSGNSQEFHKSQKFLVKLFTVRVSTGLGNGSTGELRVRVEDESLWDVWDVWEEKEETQEVKMDENRRCTRSCTSGRGQ